MKFSSKTVVFQEMVGKAIKGASCDKMIPLTSLMAIELKNKQLKLITTDASNYLYILQKDVEGDDFYVVVQAEQFSKLISKLTSENVVLELDGQVLNIKANGNYKIELPLDENGELIKYPDPVAIKGKPFTEIKLSTIKTILNTNKASLAITMEEPVYTGYYVADRVVTTDTFKMCGLNTPVFEEPAMISPELMNLLDIMTDEKISVYKKDDDILQFVSKDCIVYGHKMEGVEDYEIETISTMLDEKFKSRCKINKTAMLSLLDRISLFVGEHDDKAIVLTFTKEGIDVSSKQSSGVESIAYIESKGFKAFTCKVAIDMLAQLIKANASETVEMEYGNAASIKIVDGDVTQVIALLDDSQEE